MTLTVCQDMTHIHVVTIHNMTRTAETWQAVKGRIIARYRTVSHLARQLECHPNAIRGAVEGKCPKVRAKLKRRSVV